MFSKGADVDALRDSAARMASFGRATDGGRPLVAPGVPQSWHGLGWRQAAGHDAAGHDTAERYAAARPGGGHPGPRWSG